MSDTVIPEARRGLRERKKARTRQTIIEVAMRLFVEQGYDETTLVQIADAAEIAPSTFFSYFPSKIDIVFGLTDGVIESARKRIVDRDSGELTTHAVLAWVKGDLLEIERPYSHVLQQMPGIIQSVPELVAEDRLRLALLEDVFAQGFARDFNERPDGMRSHVMAVVTLRGMLDVWNAWYAYHATDADLDLTEVFVQKAEYLESIFDSGMSAIESLPALPHDA